MVRTEGWPRLWELWRGRLLLVEREVHFYNLSEPPVRALCQMPVVTNVAEWSKQSARVK